MIGYYVHHQGSGHRQRALSIARHLGDDVKLLGSLGAAVDAPVRYLELGRDDVPAAAGDVTADGSLHWAPLGHPGLRLRHGELAAWLTAAPARLLVSDVSVEVLLLARLLSVPPVAVALRGDRTDRPHAAGYDAAIAILAPWTRQDQPGWPARWLAKTTWLGMLSRFDGRAHEPSACDLPGTCVVMVLGRGGHDLERGDLVEAAAVHGVHWHVLGETGPVPDPWPSAGGRLLLHGDVPDPWPLLCAADVVVATAGDNAVAEVAAARAPLVAVPQARPFDEQVEHVRDLVRHGLCVAARPWPTRAQWPALFAAAQEIGGDGWTDQCDGRGAERAAAALRELAADAGRRRVGA